MGCSCGWRSHSPFDNTRILQLQKWTVTSFSITKILILCQCGTDLISNKYCPHSSIATRSRRRPTSANYLPWQKSIMGTEFFFYMVELEWCSWWTLFFWKSQEGAPSIERTVWFMVYNIWKDSSGQDFLEFKLFCFKKVTIYNVQFDNKC